jgi:hypothetical protein
MYSAAVRARLRDPSLRERVKVLGVLPKEVGAALYRDAELFALPRVRAVRHGLRRGNGVRSPGRRTHNIEGVIVPRADVLALGRALATLAFDEELRGRLGANVRLCAQTFATWKDTARLFFTTLRAPVACS